MRLFGIVVLILGFLSLAAPAASAAAVGTVIGIFLVIGGVARIVWAFKAGSFGAGVLVFLLGGVMVVAGVAVVGRPMLGAVSLTLLLAIYFLVDGIVEIVGAFKIKPAQGWGAMVFGGVISVLLGWMIWSQWPLSGAWAIGVLVGIRLIFAGTTMLMFGSALKGATQAAHV